MIYDNIKLYILSLNTKEETKNNKIIKNRFKFLKNLTLVTTLLMHILPKNKLFI